MLISHNSEPFMHPKFLYGEKETEKRKSVLT